MRSLSSLIQHQPEYLVNLFADCLGYLQQPLTWPLAGILTHFVSPLQFQTGCAM